MKQDYKRYLPMLASGIIGSLVGSSIYQAATQNYGTAVIVLALAVMVQHIYSIFK